MFQKIRLLLPLVLLGAAFAAPLLLPTADERRLEVLFFGAPRENGPGHDPVTRYRVLKKALGTEGINLSYLEEPAKAFTPETLGKFDAVLMYANWNMHDPMPAGQLKALLDYVRGGGGFLPIHCASACYGGSPEFVRLVGGRFKSHQSGVFQVRDIEPNHPILKGLDGFKAWDETYVHDSHGEDREILQKREDEPWTWTRTEGEGRVFYTASGHDHRVWDLPEFHDLLRNAIYWAVGPDKYQLMRNLDLPEPGTERVELPGYLERKAITEAQEPLPPEESIKLIQVPHGMRVVLFASEPDIVNPIHVAWDHRGRAFVVETIDYPNNLQQGNTGNDRITICEDTDGDGRADKFTRFAEKLSIPTSLVFVNGGLLCTNGSEVLFLKDTDGDDRADVREVVLDGFGMGDTHAGPSNLRYGIDGWIYATVGYSGFRGEVGGESHDFGQAVFRFLPDGSKLEVLQNTTNNTWGLGFTEEFEVVGSTANANPSWYLTFPRKEYESARLKQERTPRADDNPLFNPMSMDIRQVDQHGRYTSAAGHAVYTARRFPEDYWNRVAFVCGPTGKLVGHFDLQRDGAGWKAVQSRNNLFASADAWTAPVCAEVGPDGAVWICDWYNLVIQHNPTPNRQSAGISAERGKGNAYSTPHRDKEHGRIYRVFPEDSPDDPNPGLDPDKPASWFTALDHPNLLWRLHAQQMILDNADPRLVPELARVAKTGSAGSPHALHALHALGGLDDELATAALTSSLAPLRRAALAVASPAALKAAFGENPILEADGRELADTLVALSSSAADPAIGGLIFRTAESRRAILDDPVIADAWRIAARRQADGELAAAGDTEPSGRLQGELLALKSFRSEPEPVAITRRHKPDPEVHSRGREVFNRTCIACHGADGKGVPQAFPPLDGSDWVTGAASVPIRIILHGMMGPVEVNGETYNSAMAPLGPVLSDQEVADVLTYVRQSWTNDAPPVSADEVAKARSAEAGRTTMWTAKELGR